MILAFIVGYVCIAMEHKLQVNKAASALMTAGVLWVIYIMSMPLTVPEVNGAAFSAEEYPELAKAYPTNKLPDLRGEFIRGWDDGRGMDSGRAILSAQGDAIRNIYGEFRTVNTENYSIWEAAGSFKGAIVPLSPSTNNSYFSLTRSMVTERADGAVYPKVIGLDASRIVPTAIYVPSVISITLLYQSYLLPPTDFFHCSFPFASYFAIKQSALPLFVNPLIFVDVVYPTAIYPPSDVFSTSKNSSSPFPSILDTHFLTNFGS